jgi:hypothetical protein
VHAPAPRYKFYIRDDDDEVHACQFFHQIGYDGKTCMHAGRRHHQKYLTIPLVSGIAQIAT